MSDAFDPYFKWLGIPKADQPPHAYRLLGIELFESDADVISNAADGRMAQIKSFQSGKFAAISQKLLNEIAAAKVCLLNPQKKAEYDRRLRAHLKEKNASASAKVDEAEIPEAALAPEDGIANLPFLDYAKGQTRTTARPVKKANQAAWLIPAGLSGAAIAVVIGIVVYLSFAGDGKGKSSNPQTASLAGGDREPTPKPPARSTAGAAEPSPKPTADAAVGAVEKTDHPDSSAGAVPLPETVSSPKTEVVDKPEKTSMEDPDSKQHAEKGPEKAPDKTATVDSPAGEKAPPKKPPIPDKEQYSAMRSKIVKIFQKEFSEAKTPEAKLALAMKLDKQGDASKDDPVERFSLWRIAADGASEAGEFSMVVDIVDKIQGDFDVDGDAMKSELFNVAAARTTITPDAARNLCEAALKIAAAAANRDDFEKAAQFAKLAINTAPPRERSAVQPRRPGSRPGNRASQGPLCRCREGDGDFERRSGRRESQFGRWPMVLSHQRRLGKRIADAGKGERSRPGRGCEAGSRRARRSQRSNGIGRRLVGPRRETGGCRQVCVPTSGGGVVRAVPARTERPGQDQGPESPGNAARGNEIIAGECSRVRHVGQRGPGEERHEG